MKGRSVILLQVDEADVRKLNSGSTMVVHRSDMAMAGGPIPPRSTFLEAASRIPGTILSETGASKHQGHDRLRQCSCSFSPIGRDAYFKSMRLKVRIL